MTKAQSFHSLYQRSKEVKMAKILIIDDEPNNVQLLKMDLEDEGHDIVSGCDGVDGWRVLEEHGTSIRLILLDRMMPNMDGMEFMAKIKEHDTFKAIPVIMQTAAAEKDQVAEGIRAGVYYYLTKPYDEEVLLSVVNSALENKDSYDELSKELCKHQKCFGMTTHTEWEFQTLDQSRDMAAFVASYFPDPERVLLGLSELFINAIEHGNLGITYEEKSLLNQQSAWQDEVEKRQNAPEYKDKKVKVVYEKKEDHIELSVADQGKGFDWNEYIEISPQRATHSHGRGIAMSKMLSFDEMEYIPPGNKVVCRVFF